MSTLKEMEAQVLKVKERSRERLKIINQLTEENKELRIQNKFLVDRLEVWAERNFAERQKNINMTVDEVVEQSKNKMDYKKEQELAKTVDEVKERVMTLDTKGISKGEENENS
jgi:regulator of replication initiation timing|tara:strand:+ start:51 stop:389 length:339 start_codon:yes stop_codon:yes gene_type:complete